MQQQKEDRAVDALTAALPKPKAEQLQLELHPRRFDAGALAEDVAQEIAAARYE